MAYSSYAPSNSSQPQAVTTYGQYHPSAGTYTQPTSNPSTYPTAYTTGVTGYGSWHYPYGYVTQQGQSYASRPPGSGIGVSTSGVSSSQRPSFATYPATYSPYRKDSGQPTSLPASSAAARALRKQSNFKGLFAKELKSLMYGFGDDRNPANDTVNVMEEILIEYICDVCQVAVGPSRKSRLSIEDLRRALSRPPDAKKLARMEELLFMQEDIKRARAQFEESDMTQSKAFQA